MKKLFFSLAFVLFCVFSVLAQIDEKRAVGDYPPKTYGTTYHYTAIIDDTPVKVELIDTQDAYKVRLIISEHGQDFVGKGARTTKNEQDRYNFSVQTPKNLLAIYIIDVSGSLGQPPMTTLLGNMRQAEDYEGKDRKQIALFKSE